MIYKLGSNEETLKEWKRKTGHQQRSLVEIALSRVKRMLGLQQKMVELKGDDSKRFAEFLIHGPWVIQELERVARQKVQMLRFVNEIEVFLAYPVKLKEKLDIDIEVSEMLYFACSGVTKEDLDAAESFIKETLSGPDAVPNIFVKRDDWIGSLKLNYEEEFSAIEAERDQLSEASDGSDYIEIIEKYNQKLVELTKKVLKV